VAVLELADAPTIASGTSWDGEQVARFITSCADLPSEAVGYGGGQLLTDEGAVVGGRFLYATFEGNVVLTLDGDSDFDSCGGEYDWLQRSLAR
jgi:hypothetical protein